MKKTYKINGMHCLSCKILLEDNLAKISGVKNVSANTKKKEIIVEAENINDSEIIDIVEGLGYEVGTEKLPYLSLSKDNFSDLVLGLVFALAAIFIFQTFSLQGLIKNLSTTNIGTVFAIGLVAGFSSCMALVGGLVMGVSARYSEKHPEATAFSKFKPHVFFNIGRIISFSIFGALLGTVGQYFKVNSLANGLVIIIASVFMFILGLQLLEIFPRLNAFNFIPKSLFKSFEVIEKSEKKFNYKNVFLLSALSFFLPCGFTQAMQIFAISSGSPVRGAIVMGFFAAGTSFGLLSIGGMVANIKNSNFGRILFKSIAIIVILLSISNFQNSLKLLGYSGKRLGGTAQQSTDTFTNISAASQIKVFKAVYDPSDVNQTIKPNKFELKVGDVVRIEILAKENGQGCMGSVMIPGLYNEVQYFQKDKAVIMDFEAKKAGKFYMMCAMGVPSGEVFIVP